VKFRAEYPLCVDCGEFDKESWDFASSNLCRCKASGSLRWVGTPASDCADFRNRAESVFDLIPF
jgi:hypothetical protein